MARLGKIARLPDAIREELNRRLRNGAAGPQLLPWLNGQAEVRAVLDEFFSGADVNAQNLSDWRNGGYEEWLEKQDRHHRQLERTRELASMSVKLAEAGGRSLSEGASAIIAGNILQLLEELDDVRNLPGEEGETPEARAARLKDVASAMDDLTASLARVRSGDHTAVTLEQNAARLRQKDEDLKLAREQFDQRLREYQDKVAAQKREIEGAITAARDGGLTAETLTRIEEAVKIL